MRYLGITLIVCALGPAACQNAQPQSPASNAAPSVNHAEEARKAFTARNWSTAAPHFRAAIALDPGSLTLHHGLATCASWLGLIDEATVEFNWVLAHAPSGSAEAQIAREWLATLETETDSKVAADDPADPKRGDAGVHGVVTWEAPGQPYNVLPRAQLHLRGLPGTPTQGLSYYLRSDKEGRYEFSRIKAGPYRLTDAIAGDARWNLKIEVKSAENLALDLSPSNGTANRNDFPTAQASAPR